MPIIGVAGVTIPGAVDCILKINLYAKKYFSDHHHPHIVLEQPDFAVIHHAQNSSRWDIVEKNIILTLQKLASSGAQFAIIPANTVHKVISGVQQAVSIPVINILEVVSDQCAISQFKRVGIMGTRWTMNDHLYRDYLKQRNITEVIPSEENQHIIQHAIFFQLIPNGAADEQTMQQLLRVVECLKSEGCDAIALACTELPLVLNSQNCGVAVLDATSILAEFAVENAHRLYTRMI